MLNFQPLNCKKTGACSVHQISHRQGIKYLSVSTYIVKKFFKKNKKDCGKVVCIEGRGRNRGAEAREGRLAALVPAEDCWVRRRQGRKDEI